MRKLLFGITFLSMMFATAQETIKVVYEQQNHNPIPENQQHNANFKLANSYYNNATYDFELLIRGSESIFQRIPHLQEDGFYEIDGELFIFDEPDNRTYYRDTQQQWLMYDVNEKQAVVDTIKSFDWKIEREEFTYFGYKVKKAIFTNEYSKSEAYFAPKLNYSTGPWSLGGLPGLILYYKLTYNDGFSIEYRAKEISVLEEEVEFQVFDSYEILDAATYQKQLEAHRKKASEMYEAGVDTSE